MSSYIQHDQDLLNWPISQEKETANTFDNLLMDFNASYPATYSTSAAPSFQPTVYEESPIMATPFLDSGSFSPIQTSHSSSNHTICCPLRQTINTPVEHYLGVENFIGGDCSPAFNGDPMALLVRDSESVNTSPTYSSPSDDITTPLFGPIESSPSDGVSSNQQELEAFLQEHPKFEGNDDLMDWPCYRFDDAPLFQELEGASRSNTYLPLDSKSLRFVLDQQHSTTHDNRSTATATTSKSSSSKSNKRKRNNGKGQTTKKGKTTTNQDDQQDNGDDKKRSGTKARSPDQNEKRYGCPICRRKFSRRYNLNTHIRTHNVNRVKEFVCDICNYGFDRKHDRDRHIVSVHRALRHYGCTQCDASFCRRDALVRHSLKSHPQYP